MAVRELAVQGGVIRLRIDSRFKARVNDLLQRRFRPGSQSGGPTLEQARELFLSHPYLVHDPWVGPEQDDLRARLRRCQAMLAGLTERVRRGEVAFLGLENATGQAELTAEKLSDRQIRLLDVSENWLLLTVERHPFGGTGSHLEQWWLYSKQHRTVELLHVGEVGVPAEGRWRVQSRGGPWRDPDASHEVDFYEKVAALLGADAVDSLKRMSQLQDGLCHSDETVLSKVKQVTGIDVAEQDRKVRQSREAACLRRFGSRTGPPGMTLAMDAGVRLGYARER